MAHDKFDDPTHPHSNIFGAGMIAARLGESPADGGRSMRTENDAAAILRHKSARAGHSGECLHVPPLQVSAAGNLVSLCLTYARLRLADTIRAEGDDMLDEAIEMVERAQMLLTLADEVEAAARAGKRPRIRIDRYGNLVP